MPVIKYIGNTDDYTDPIMSAVWDKDQTRDVTQSQWQSLLDSGRFIDATPYQNPESNAKVVTNPVTGGIGKITSGGAVVGTIPGKNGGALKGDVLHRFTSAAALTPVSSGVLSNSAGVTFEGAQTVKYLSPSAGTVAGLQITGLSAPMRTASFVLLCYIPDYSKVQTITPYVSQGATLTPNYINYTGYSLVNDSHRYNGWHAIEVSQNMWTAAGTGAVYDGTSAKVLRIDVTPTPGNVAEVYFAVAYLNTSNQPSIIFTWDDCRTTQYTNVFRIANKYSIPTNVYAIPTLFGAANHFTADQGREIEAWGGVMANHAMYDAGAGGDSYEEIGLAAYSAQVFACRDWLDANRFLGGAHHAYVEGKYDQLLADALAAGGIKTARCISGNTTTGAQSMTEAWGVQRRLALKGGMQFNSARSLAEMKTEVDRAVRDGRSLIFTGHDIFTAAEGGAGGISWLDTDLDALMDYVAAYRAKGMVKTPNLVDWYNSLVLPS